MGKGFYVSRSAGQAVFLLGVAAAVAIIVLAIMYAQERSTNTAISDGEGTGVTPASASPSTKAPSHDPWDQYRLPKTLRPEYYNVTLWPRLQKDQNGMYIFTGNSSVVFTCVKETDLILIHSNKLNLTTIDGHLARLTSLDSAAAPAVEATRLQVETQYLVVQLSGLLTAGESYRLETEFQGELSDDLGGLYRSEYVEDGVPKVLATSQMQPTDARKVFPCFDEPAMKAVFHITLIHEPGTVALSNAMARDAINTVIKGTKVTVTRFEATNKMSTYILAFIICDFTYITTPMAHGNVLVRIWARRKAIEQGQGDYAGNVTGPILTFFESYFNVTYPLPKSDQIALPDFNAGAMENWGLITYRETALLYDPAISSNGNKERVLTVIAHELAHMWFGNLVTLNWWNDLWLNEGFASYVEYLGADHAEPTWNIKDSIILSDVHRVFAVDALASSHPLSTKEEEINSPADISQLFDTITYCKGASVLRMLSEFLTEPVFVKGLSTYLNHFAYKNTIYTDLWDHLQEAVDSTPSLSLPHSVNDIMNRWIHQMGFPVVTVDTHTGELSQKHFLLDSESVVEKPSEFNYEWFIPITWNKAGVEKGLFWLLKKTDAYSPMKVTGNEWVLANVNITGYYRVNYDSDNWERLLNQLNSNHRHTQSVLRDDIEDHCLRPLRERVNEQYATPVQLIPVINRAQIVDDAFNLARAKILNITLALRTTVYLREEREVIPWQSAMNNLNYFFLMFDRSEVYGPMQAYLKKLVTPLWSYFQNITQNWTRVPSDHNDQYNQVNAIWLACITGMETCKDLTKGWFKQWMQQPAHNPIHPNLKTTVYCHAIAAGGADEWDFAWAMFKNASSASEADKLRSALACTKQPWLLNRYLDYTLDPTKIRKQDAISTIVYISRNVVGQTLAWNFVRERWAYLFSQYGGSSFSFANLISGVTSRFSSKFELQQLQQFMKDNESVGFGAGALALEQAVASITANMKWLVENKEPVLNWFISQT